MANENNLKPIQTLPPFKHFCCTIGNLPTSYLESMTYYEMLNWFCDYLKNTVIPTINNNAEAIKELQRLYIILKNYVDNYFENLDVQEEINNKLDEMVQTGELNSIIEVYLNSVTFKVFNNINELKKAKLNEGQFVETLGYDTQNDGGNGKFVVVSGTYTDENIGYIPLNNGLFAKILTRYFNGKINAKLFGAKGNGVNDDFTALQKAILFCADNDLSLFLPNGNYLISSQLKLVLSNNDIRVDKTFIIEGESNNTTINKFGNDETFNQIFDFNYVRNLFLTNIYSSTLGLTLVPSNIYSQGYEYWTNWLKQKHFVFNNCFGIEEGVQQLITLPAPATPERFSDENYDNYPLKIVSNSGYNAIEIENFGYNLEDETSNPTDNSAIGIIDNVTNSTGVIYIRMSGDRNFLRFDNPNANVKSNLKPNTVYEVSANGHIAIGCSTDFNDTVAKSTAPLKLRDANPKIDLFDTNNPLSDGYPGISIQAGNSIDNSTNSCNIYVKGNRGLEITNKGINNLNVNQNSNIDKLKASITFNIIDANPRTRYLSIDGSDRLRYGGSGNDQDSAIQLAYYKNGATWQNTYTQRTTGMCVFDTATNKPIWFNGTNWVDANGNVVITNPNN